MREVIAVDRRLDDANPVVYVRVPGDVRAIENVIIYVRDEPRGQLP